MGFDHWASSHPKAAAEHKGYVNEAEIAEFQEAFVVDNSQLNTDSRGIAYRESMNMKDKLTRIAEFNSVVRGVVCKALDGSQWLRVEDQLFLPLQVGNKEVLRRSWWDAEEPRQLAEELRQKPAAQVSPARDVEEVEDFVSPPEVRSLEPGSGALYEVVCERLPLRKAPHPKAPMQGTRRQGQILELFDWDVHRHWRRVATKLGSAWAALDVHDAATGRWTPLLRPQGLPFSLRPLDPLCQAAREGSAPDVQRFIGEGLAVNGTDLDGQTPLACARQKEGWQGLVCCVLLLEANADPNLALGPEEQMRLEVAQLEQEKLLAVEQEDYKLAETLKQRLAALRASPQHAVTSAGATAAAELLKALHGHDFEAPRIHRAYDELRGVTSSEVQNIPSRVEALLQEVAPAAQLEKLHVSSSRTDFGVPRTAPSPAPSPAATAAPRTTARAVAARAPQQEDDEGVPWLQNQLPITESDEARVSVVKYRVLQKAPVFQEPSMSSELLGHLPQHQLVEVFGYDMMRSFGRVRVKPRDGDAKDGEPGWVLLEDEFKGDLLKAVRV
ncbi:unnamed protein product [Durusdinium trenchii]|uniref:Uncharacterized protein n=2 Tax=Durusdinium trenchii TaxID=1381693 RepID=A0ABP0KBA6_9DINO